eukprot:Em0023g649a
MSTTRTPIHVEVKKIKPGNLIYADKDTRNADRGQYGVVRKATWNDLTVAVKSFYPDKRTGFQEELLCLTKLKHRNIVIMHGAWWDDAGKENRLIVLEYAPLTLEKVLYDHSDYEYTDNHVMHWSRQIVCGLEYMHGLEMLHRDVKPSNVLLFQDGTLLKLCDFGTAKEIQSTLTNAVGTIRYMAPEVIIGKHYTASADIFSFAITLWEMITRKRPTLELGMEKADGMAIMFKMAQGGRPVTIRGLPKLLEEIMTKCWAETPNDRPSTAVLKRKLDTLCEMYYKKMEPLSKKSNKASGKSTATENTELTQRENSVVTQRENSVVTQRENTGVTLWENTGVTQRENTGMTQRENTGVTQRENLNDIAEGTSVKQVTSTPSRPAGIVSNPAQPVGNQPGVSLTAGNQSGFANLLAGNQPRTNIANSSPQTSVGGTELSPHKAEGHHITRQASSPVEFTSHYSTNHPYPWPYHGGGPPGGYGPGGGGPSGGYGPPGPTYYPTENPYKHREGYPGGGGEEVGRFEMDEDEMRRHWQYLNEEQPRLIREYIHQQQWKEEFPKANLQSQYFMDILEPEWQPIIPDDKSEESMQVYQDYIKLARDVSRSNRELVELGNNNSRMDKEISCTQDTLKEYVSLQTKRRILA